MDSNQLLIASFISDHPLEAAYALEKLPDESVADFLTRLPKPIAVRIINYMHSYKLACYLELIEPDLAVYLIEMSNLDAAHLAIRQSNEKLRESILQKLSTNRSAQLKIKLFYQSDTVGSLMSPSFLALRKETTVRDAVSKARQEKDRVSSQLYVVNADSELEGIVKLDDLFFADHDHQLSKIMQSEIPKFVAETEVESIKSHQGWIDFQHIPVVDSANKLIGSISFETVKQDITKPPLELSKDIIDTSNALGELFRIGLTGFFQSLSK